VGFTTDNSILENVDACVFNLSILQKCGLCVSGKLRRQRGWIQTQYVAQATRYKSKQAKNDVPAFCSTGC